MVNKRESLEQEILEYALDPAHQDEFARLLNHILPAYVHWTWRKDGLYRRHFNEWQRHGFNLAPNHYCSPIPDVGKLTVADFERRSELVGVELREPEQLVFLETCAAYRNEYTWFPDSGPAISTEFHFNNGTFHHVDAEVLYCMVRHYKPRRIVEIGAGYSTLITARACEVNRTVHGVECTFTAIEPSPHDIFLHLTVPGLTRLVRQPLREVDMSAFSVLEENDILFIDSSHVLKIGSDVQREYLEIIPRLRPGVLVHAHDIFLPAEYHRDWILDDHIFWNEQYLLQAFLAFNAEFEVVWAGSYMHLKHAGKLMECFPGYDPKSDWPGSFWFRRRNN